MADFGVLTVKNWRTFQHYGKRAPTWIKVYRGLVDDHSWGHLPDESKAHLVGLWLLAAHAEGNIPCDPDWIARRINATGPINFQTLISHGFIVADTAASRTLAQYASKSLALCASLEEKRREELSNSLDHLQGEQPPPAGGHVPHPVNKPARVREGFLEAAGRSGKSAFLDEVDALRREAGAE